MQELSLNVLDIADNSVKAGAKNIEINISVQGNVLTIEIKDDGCGMSKEFLSKVTDPYSTTRKTRNVGLGIPFFKMEAELSGGEFTIESEEGKGTDVKATFMIDSIDRPPLGDLSETITALLPACNERELKMNFEVNDEKFVFDTRELKEQLEGVPVDEPYVLQFVKEMIQENITSIVGGVVL